MKSLCLFLKISARPPARSFSSDAPREKGETFAADGYAISFRPARHLLRLRGRLGAGIAAGEVEAVGAEFGGRGAVARLFEAAQGFGGERFLRDRRVGAELEGLGLHLAQRGRERRFH